MEEELKEAKERIAKLEVCLIRVAKLAWSAVKDERDAAEQSYLTLKWNLEEMQKAGLDKWLPTLADAQGAFNATEEALGEASKRRDMHCIDQMLKATASEGAA